MRLIKDIPPLALAPGITGHYTHGDLMTLGYVELKAGSQIPVHQHQQEQITYLIEGRLDMIIGETACSLTGGMVHVIPGGTPHSAVAVTDCKVIDAFSPVRQDYVATT